VQADVEDDAGGAQFLGVEHPEPVPGVVEEAELGHEAFGVERPALGVCGTEVEQPGHPCGAR